MNAAVTVVLEAILGEKHGDNGNRGVLDLVVNTREALVTTSTTSR